VTSMTADELVVAEPARFWSRPRKVGAGFVAAGVIAAALFGSLATDRPARLTLAETTAGAAVGINGTVGAIVFGLLAALAGGALLAGVGGPTVHRGRWFGALLGAGIVGIVLSFLCWQISQAPEGLNVMPLGDVTRSSLLLALPLIFGSLSGLLCERSGIINVAIEGQFLMGAFGAALGATVAGSVWVGVGAAAAGGVVVAAILAVLAIRYLVDQIVLGIVLNVFALGLTGFLYEQIMSRDQSSYNQPDPVPVWTVPGLSQIPVLGPLLFKANFFVYAALALVVILHFGLRRTRWGLRTRAVGEHPAAADTVGIKVLALRYRNVLLAGVIAGLGGGYFTLLSTTNFNKGMTGGAGFIALAAMIFGRWNPVGALVASLFFGFANALAFFLGAIASPIPNQFLNMLPYLATIVAVAGLVGKVRPPAAEGKPYVKG
jgi:ABC-type uncharacterized transport system permease subunit